MRGLAGRFVDTNRDKIITREEWDASEASTRIVDRERLGIGGQSAASPVAADGRIYVVNEPGTFAVLRAGDSLEVLAVNSTSRCSGIGTRRR